MHIFEITGAGSPVVTVFATTYSQAAEICLAHWLAQERGELPDFEVRQRNPAWPGLDGDALAKALALGISGIGRFDARWGWRIMPPGDVEDAG